MFWPCETRTSICRNLATISSGLYRFLAIAVLLDVKDIPQVGPLQWGRITNAASYDAFRVGRRMAEMKMLGKTEKSDRTSNPNEKPQSCYCSALPKGSGLCLPYYTRWLAAVRRCGANKD